MLDRLEQAVVRGARNGASVGVIFWTSTGSKTVNDTLGHVAGDLVLTAVAQRLLAASRASDTVGRVGGDELVVVVEDAGQVADASSCAERLRLAVIVPVQVHDGSVDVACSVGVALSQR